MSGAMTPAAKAKCDGLVFEMADMLAEERTALALDGDAQGTALCLSGGGVRSAAFCLGVLQVLASNSLLHPFTYLSTVSGGGYIGGFLRRAIAQTEIVNTYDNKNADRDLAHVLKRILHVIDSKGTDAEEESPELHALRRNASFLAPDQRLASLDTWAGIVLWLRNTLINWTVFLPLLIGVAATPVTYLACADLFGMAPLPDGVNWHAASLIPGCLGLLCLGLAVFRTCTWLPSHYFPDAAGSDAAEIQTLAFGAGWKTICNGVLLPVWAWIFLAPLALVPIMHLPDVGRPPAEALIAPAPPPQACAPAAPPQCPLSVHIPGEKALQSGGPWWVAALLPSGTLFVNLVSFLLAWLYVVFGAPYTKGTRRRIGLNRWKHSRIFQKNFFKWLVSAAGSAGLMFLGIRFAQGRSVLWVAVLGPPWMTLCELLRSTFYIALRRHGLRADLDREWLARLNAAKVQPVLLAALGTGAALALPLLVFDNFSTTWSRLVTIAGLLTGPVAAMVGKSTLTVFAPSSGSDTGSKFVPKFVPIFGPSVLALLFAVAAAMLAGREDASIAALAAARFTGLPAQHAAFTVAAFGLAIGGTLLAFGLASAVNLNRFTMHAVYRNRLVRAFFGSACAQADNADPSSKARAGARHPDAFTQFDPADNPRLYDCWKKDWRRTLFPVINMALNETDTKDTARQERKAISFTMTPLRCGARPPDHPGAYVRTRDYAGADQETGPDDGRKGVTLGTAVTISGAAFSPNMGYQSSPALAFIMTLFNVRLGAWLPNPLWPKDMGQPGQLDRLRRSGPRSGLTTLLSELVGRSREDNQFAYLSDGGHFDNLGLYEMLRRRCSLILVVDAGRDDKYVYKDLGHALQRARIDFGTTISFVQPLETLKKTLSPVGAFANICYREKGKISAGRMIYIKPWLPENMPTELKVFKALRESFPHETTLDQFFTESDFESYRRLGEFLAETLIDACAGEAYGKKPDSIKAVFDFVEKTSKSERNVG